MGRKEKVMTDALATLKMKFFDGRINFSLWQCKVQDLYLWIHHVLKGKKAENGDDEAAWEDMKERAIDTLCLCLAYEIS